MTQAVRYGRRPLLHVIVLFATNAPVLAYAHAVAEQFLAFGMDVMVQATRTPADAGTAPARPWHAIDPARDLAALLVGTHADYVVVVGDRDMRARQVRTTRKRALVALSVDTLQKQVWKGWPTNPHKNWARILALTDVQLDALTEQYVGTGPDAAAALAGLQRAALPHEGTRGVLRPSTYRPNAAHTPDCTVAPLLHCRLLARAGVTTGLDWPEPPPPEEAEAPVPVFRARIPTAAPLLPHAAEAGWTPFAAGAYRGLGALALMVLAGA
jgi:hypothetical protein